MLNGRSRIGTAALLAAGLTGGYLATGAVGAGSGTPANKVVAAGSHRVVAGPNEEVVLLTATAKTSKPTDLMFHTALECTIFTGLVTDSDNPSSSAQSSIRVWIEVDDKIVPIVQASSPPQNGSTPPFGGEADKVTFCDREYSRTVTDDENPLDGIDKEDDYIRTKSSHAFNWLQFNLGSGLHKIEVVAELTEAVTGGGQTSAEIGNRTLIVEPTKMANDAVIAEGGAY